MANIDIVLNREAEGWPDELARALDAAARLVLAECLTTSADTIELGITLADDETVQALNRDHRGQDKPTNVLSFPLTVGDFEPGAPGAPLLLGDIILAFETVAREAAEQGKTLPNHALHLVIHGTLHLLGHDHDTDDDATTMERLETALMGKLGIADPYSSSPERP